MARHNLVVILVLLVAFLALGIEAEAGGVVRFHVKVLDAMKISNPESIDFPAVAPGKSVQQDLSITVWSNVKWGLKVRAVDNEDLQGAVEFSAAGIWHELSHDSLGVLLGQPPTGPGGATIEIPFILHGGYEHVAGDYTFEVEFTVVPSI